MKAKTKRLYYKKQITKKNVVVLYIKKVKTTKAYIYTIMLPHPSVVVRGGGFFGHRHGGERKVVFGFLEKRREEKVRRLREFIYRDGRWMIRPKCGKHKILN